MDTGLLGPPWLDAQDCPGCFDAWFSALYEECSWPWRVPTMDELEGLGYALYDAVFPEVFPDLPASPYVWTANSADSEYAWVADITDSGVFIDVTGGYKSDSNYILCVKSGL